MMDQYPTHQSILAFDVEGFSDSHRNDNAQLAVRAGFYHVLRAAFSAGGLPWDSCMREDRGDGAIVLISPNVSKVLLLDPLLGCLAAALAEHNRTALLGERFRLRIAIHAGEVSSDANGLSGADLVSTCRMLDADVLRTALRNSSGDLAVIVSNVLYDAIVRHRYRDIDPARYHPVSVQVKKSRINAWLHLPDTTAPPVTGSGPPRKPVEPPRQLPPAAGVFVGREVELRALDKIAADDEGAVAGRLVVLVGPPGVGTTALAIHWAHRTRDQYEDGQLYADLGGPRRAVSMAQILERFLRALGIAAEHVPVGADEQAALFRTLTADLRLLILLDNAESASDVRALLPVSARTMTLVTGRSRLGSLATEGARFVELDPLTPPDGVRLLARSVGMGRINAESRPAQRLVRLCGGLPVALCVVGARLAARPHWLVQKVVSDLLDEGRRLARLSFGDDLSVRAVFDVSYQALSVPAARLYRLLGLHPGEDFDAGVAAAMTGSPLLAAEELIEELLNANLLDEPRAGRFRFHDLIRLHARQQAEAAETTGERSLAVRRMLDWYLHTASLAGRLITPHRTVWVRGVEHVPTEPMSFSSHAEALDWLDRERVNVFTSARYAHDHDMPVKAWQLADSMWGLFLYRTHYQDWLQCDLLAVRAAQLCAEPAMEAESRDRLGLLYHALGHNDQALEHMNFAAAIWHQLDQRPRMASSLERIGFAYLDQGRHDSAIDHFSRALAGYRALGEQRSSGLALISLGRALIAAGRAVEALSPLRDARRELESLTPPDPYNLARAFLALGRAQSKANLPDDARDLLSSALTMMRSVGSPLGEADVLWAQAELYEQTGEVSRARHSYEGTVALLTELGNPAAGRVREHLQTLGPSAGPS